MTNKPLVIAVAGGSGSGKTFLAEQLATALADRRPLLLSQDYYYRDRSDLSFSQRQTINYDHPDAIEFSLLIEQLQALCARKSITHPVYDFSQHNRRAETIATAPSDIILLDGILLLAVPELAPLLDVKIFVDTAMDICFIRRLQRDTAERGRSVQSVIDQYTATVRPMYLQYVYPSRQNADMIVSGEEAVGSLVNRILLEIGNRHPSCLQI
jgi:uridine kinase